SSCGDLQEVGDAQAVIGLVVLSVGLWDVIGGGHRKALWRGWTDKEGGVARVRAAALSFQSLSDFARGSCHARLFLTVMPILRSLICVTTGPLPLLISRCAVHTETPFTWAHCATVITRASSSARASSSGSDWWWRVTYTSSLGGVLTSSCSIVVRT